MKKEITLLVCLLMYAVKLFSQANLIINPSFEDTTGCPNQIAQVNKATGWDTYRGTPDFFHSCANSSAPFFGVPVNARGYQHPHTGSAYCGLFTFAKFIPNDREFIGRPLAAPLTVGQKYFVSFWVNHVDTSLTGFATDNMGAKFTTSAYSFSNPDSVNNQPHVFTSTILTDTANWIQVCGSFIADSAYTHIEIGNFFDDVLTDTVRIHQVPLVNYAYYLIDDVCVSADSGTCCSFEQALTELSGQQFQIFPSPASNYVAIKSSTIINSIKISDTKSKLVANRNIFKPEAIIETNFLSDGIYFLTIETNHGTIVRKLIVQKN